MEVCPTTATRRRPDGIVAIRTDICIGCAYCVMACPYQARYKVQAERPAYGGADLMPNEAARSHPERLGVSQKCNFCAERVDAGLARGLAPGRDPDATPACVNSCIAGALTFGNIDEPDSSVSSLLARHDAFRMHEELGTEPGVYYLWQHRA
jgi:phenylacetyl-CoA:acceptor oxidoreductase subunit 1